MRIFGNGVDIIDNSRIEKSIKIKGFINRIFTKNEISDSKKTKNKVSFFAKRFAAKEAMVKAIGTGFRNKINFKDIEVKNNYLGKPKISINKKIIIMLKEKLNLENFNIHLSLADEKKYSIAYIVIDKKKWVKNS